MTGVRVFIAIELATPMHKAIGMVQDRICQRIELPVRWVEPEQAHITLKFLGQVPEEILDSIEDGLHKAANRSGEFTVTLGKVGGFPNLRRPRVLWVGLNGDVGPLRDLQQNIEELISPLGFATERRLYHPHVTLGRASGNARIETLGWTDAVIEVDSAGQTVRQIALIKSELVPQGVAYTRLCVANLGNGL